MRAKAKKLKPLKAGEYRCADCGRVHMAPQLHMMFCPARTCDECGSSFSTVIPKREDGRRVCAECSFR